jgi:hypothetical protein
MRVTSAERLRKLMVDHRIDPHVARDIHNGVFGPNAPDESRIIKEIAEFKTLAADVRRIRRGYVQNRHRRPEDMRTLYDRYEAVLDQVIYDIEKASMALVKDPDNPEGPRVPLTLKRCAEIAAKRNAKLRAAGEPVGPACTSLWVTWVHPQVIHDLVEDVQIAYDRTGRSQGNRFQPFNELSVRQSIKRAEGIHRAFIAHQRARLYETDAEPTHAAKTGRVSHPYAALHLCALRMAELWLDGYARDIKTKHKHPALNPIPVNWLHLLTPEMRKRIRDADENPASVSRDGLDSFLNESGHVSL